MNSLLINITQNKGYFRRCQSNYTVTQESTEKTQELAEFVTTLTVSSESTNSWSAEDVSEKMLTRSASTSTDEQAALPKSYGDALDFLSRSSPYLNSLKH